MISAYRKTLLKLIRFIFGIADMIRLLPRIWKFTSNYVLRSSLNNVFFADKI